MNAPTRARLRLVATVATLIAISGCTGGSPTSPAAAAAPQVDRVGNEKITLKFATIDGPDFNDAPSGPETFAANLATVSDGRITADVQFGYGDGAAEAESDIVEAIAAGELDGGWPATRAFANAGISGVEAVEAPLLLSNYEAEKAFVTGDGADLVLDALRDSGVVGLALSVGHLRRPITAGQPLLGPEDWDGVRFRAYNSPVQVATIEALGGIPVNHGTGWADQIAFGALDGAEFDLPGLQATGFTEAPNVSSNVVLWPKVYVLSLSQKAFDGLSEEQQGWVREAAALTKQASVDAAYDESAIAEQLCGPGLRFVAASDVQLAALRQKVQPVIDDLAADEANAPIVAEIQSIAAAHPTPETATVPPNCRVAVAPASPEGADIPETVAGIPDGKYRVAITPEEVAAAGHSNADGWSGTWTLDINDGTYAVYCQPLEQPGRDCGNVIFDGALEAGDLRGTDDTVWFVYNPEILSALTGCKLPAAPQEGNCWPTPNFELNWALDGDLLTFSGPADAPIDRVLKPLERIGG